MQTVEPAIQLRDALRAFGEQPAGTVRLSVPSSEEDVRAFLAAADPATGGTDVPDDVLPAIARPIPRPAPVTRMLPGRVRTLIR